MRCKATRAFVCVCEGGGERTGERRVRVGGFGVALFAAMGLNGFNKGIGAPDLSLITLFEPKKNRQIPLARLLCK